MAYGEFYVEKEGWARWPKVLTMCRMRGRRDDGEYLMERRRYVPEGKMDDAVALLKDLARRIPWSSAVYDGAWHMSPRDELLAERLKEFGIEVW